MGLCDADQPVRRGDTQSQAHPPLMTGYSPPMKGNRAWITTRPSASGIDAPPPDMQGDWGKSAVGTSRLRSTRFRLLLKLNAVSFQVNALVVGGALTVALPNL